MRLDRSSPAGLRIFSSLKAGRSLATSARAAGVGKGPAQRWVREAFNELREAGLSVVEAQASLGFISSSMPAWDHAQLASYNRHHLQRPIGVEAAFWSAFERGASLRAALGRAGVGRSTGHRATERAGRRRGGQHRQCRAGLGPRPLAGAGDTRSSWCPP